MGVLFLTMLAGSAGLHLRPVPHRVSRIRCTEDMEERQRKVDAALAELAGKPVPEEEYVPPSPDLPAGCAIGVAGCGTPLGQRMLRTIGACGYVAVEVDANTKSLAAELSALVIISAAVYAPHGLKPPVFGRHASERPAFVSLVRTGWRQGRRRAQCGSFVDECAARAWEPRSCHLPLRSRCGARGGDAIRDAKPKVLWWAGQAAGG